LDLNRGGENSLAQCGDLLDAGEERRRDSELRLIAHGRKINNGSSMSQVIGQGLAGVALGSLQVEFRNELRRSFHLVGQGFLVLPAIEFVGHVLRAERQA
jgi:hypothetical protein